MNNYLEIYQSYINTICPEINLNSLLTENENTNWDEPISGSDFNNCAVLALIEAERTQDIETCRFYIDAALEWLEKGSVLDYLSGSHLILLYNLLGEKDRAHNLALNHSLNLLHLQEQRAQSPKGLVYIPSNLSIYNRKNLAILLGSRDKLSSI